VKSAGKASLNGSAERLKKSVDLVPKEKNKLNTKEKNKLNNKNNKVQLPLHPGGGVNLKCWIEYAIYWNNNKTLLLSKKK